MGIENQRYLGTVHRAGSQPAPRSWMERSGGDSDAGGQGPYRGAHTLGENLPTIYMAGIYSMGTQGFI